LRKCVNAIKIRLTIRIENKELSFFLKIENGSFEELIRLLEQLILLNQVYILSKVS